VAYDWQQEQQYTLRIEARGSTLTATVAGGPTLTASDDRLASGSVGLVLTEGRLICNAVTIRP
jgi:hypothetical protein